MIKYVTSLAAVVLLQASGVLAAEEKLLSLNRALARQGPEWMKYFQEQKYQNVGVLKFLVKKGADGFTDNAGTLNLDLARRLELALILAENNDVSKPIGVIRDASAVAARLINANHLTDMGKQRLFEGEYPLSWGETMVTADAFLTGEVAVSADLRTLTVTIRCFDKKGKRKVTEFEASTVADDMVQVGESFRLRGPKGKDGGLNFENKDAITSAAAVKNGLPNPLKEKEAAPVTLQILYNGKEQTVEFEGNKARVAEPNAGDKVVFVLRRTGADRLGVVLKVNGENTLFRERKPDRQCSKWILNPDVAEPLPIDGFQKDLGTDRPFVVRSREESAAREINYGADVGTISLVVFRENKGDEAKKGDAKTALDVGDYPAKPANNVQALQNQVRRSISNPLTRGIVEPGDKVRHAPVKEEKFEADEIPVFAVSITYYKKVSSGAK